MFVSKARIEGFSSFTDSQWISFSPGLNMVIGENNSGKSALLKAIAPGVPLNKHRNEDRFLEGLLPSQKISLDIVTTPKEFLTRLARMNGTVQTTVNGPSVADQDQLIEWLTTVDPIVLKCELLNGNNISSREPTFSSFLTGSNTFVCNVRLDEGNLVAEMVGAGQNDNLISAYTSGNDSGFFNFSAQRLNIAKIAFSSQPRLAQDASNLPAVLAHLTGSFPQQMREIEMRVREVISSVDQITVDPRPDGNFEVTIWPRKEIRSRQLAFSLDECGTGVAQVIAIFTAVVMSEQNVIVVDEINSFLHPQATKRLLSILSSEYPSNQYILSSHSSDAISHPSVEQMVIIERDGFESRVKIVQQNDLAQIASALRALGISMADVMGADGILWVEGATEELVFANLYQRDVGELPPGIRMSAVASTGDFSKRGASKKTVVDLYDRVTRSVAPMALGQSFILDREKLTDESVEKFERETDNKLRFLPRRCLECYAIEPEIIADILSQEIGEEIDPDDVSSLISELALDRSFGAVTSFKGKINDTDWLAKVDGANLLSVLFDRVSGSRVVYRKTHHTPLILASVDPEKLRDVTNLLKKCIDDIVLH